MRTSRFFYRLGLVLVLAAAPILAQDSAETAPAPARPTSGSDRLFLSFFQEATVIEGQWWEGRLALADWDSFDSKTIEGVAALRMSDRIEVGGQVGFGWTDADVGLDGSGATDLDVYGKYYFGPRRGVTEFAATGVLTIPTGDDQAGLGYDQFRLGGFGAIRHRLNRLILSGNIGLRFNGDATLRGPVDADGKTSGIVGFGVIAPLSDRNAVVLETLYESKRFKGGDDDFRILAGANLRVSNRGKFRAGVAAGLDDGAPDWEVLLGYAHLF